MNVIFGLKVKKTILIVSHRLSTISECDFVYKLEDGKLFQIELETKL